MRERDIICALGDMGQGTVSRIRHYIEEAFGHDILSHQIFRDLQWQVEQGYVAQSGTGPRATFALTKEGKAAAKVEGWL